MKNLKLKLTVLLISLAIFFGCSPVTYTGNWNYTVRDISQGDLTGTLSITKTETGTGHNCHVTSSDGMADFDMEECVIIEDVFTGYYFDQGARVDVSGTFDGDMFSGVVNVQGTELEVKMIRQQEEEK